jgi:alpha-mannosidase
MRPKVRMIAQAHLDPVWLWRWTEGRAEALATSRSAVDRLKEYPDLHYVRGESQVYEWIEQEAPALFAEIKELIRAGRWHVVNGMVVQPDMNLPCGESFVRQILLAKRYFQDHLGVDVRVAYCVDSFGHAGTLPQIFKKSGLDYYVMMRPGPHEKTLPQQAFWWEAPDGSRVLTYRIPDSYGSGNADHTPHLERSLAARPADLEDTMCFFGIGNHGGGPTKMQIENIKDIAAQRQDVEIVFDHPETYFHNVEKVGERLPVVVDELQFHATGCYSANSALKRTHRQAEAALLWAERMVALADVWASRPAQAAELPRLWHDLAFNEFHDTFAGSGIKEAEDEAIMCFGRIIMSCREIADSCGRLIGERVDTAGLGGTVLLFNPFPYARREYVEYEPWTEWQGWDVQGWGLVDETGKPVPHQRLEAQSAANAKLEGGIQRLVFPVDLPPMGYRLYRFAPGLPRTEAATKVQANAAGTLENDAVRVRLDGQTGAIVSCIDKATGVELVGKGGWNVAQVLEDKSDTWSHRVRVFEGPMLGQFGNARITVSEEGPLQASLFVERTWESSTWLQQIVLRAGERELTIRNWLDWQGQFRMVKLAFDAPVSAPQGVRDVPFGAYRCPSDGAEVPMLQWIDVQGTGADGRTLGVAVLNDGKCSGDVLGSAARVTVLRCPPYGYHEPHVMGLKKRYDWIDQGLQEFTLVVRPHLGAWQGAGVVRRARELGM